jgi:fructose-bisphosphate aldolase/2-amino-3,7-dideoxy-D-threo-hept-6-ulosonate synthase
MDTQHDLLEMVYDSIHSGGKGVAIGRNVFQADDPTALIAKISKIVHQGLTVDEV